jgi:catechol 2,3-dioxygenase-like lactoylglutathione lyase family enzyme
LTKLHHSAICTADMETSLTFWRDGLGYEVLMNETFSGNWKTLFNAPTNELSSIFLGDPSDASAGIVELVAFDSFAETPTPSATPSVGFFLLSLYADLEATLPRLAALGVGGVPVRILLEDSGVHMAVVRDPNGVLVELIDLGKG